MNPKVKKVVSKLLGHVPTEEREPLEVRAAIIDEIAQTLVEPIGDGRRALIFNRLTVRLMSPDATRRERLLANLSAGGGLRESILTRLMTDGVVSDNLDVELTSDQPPGTIPDTGKEFI